MFPFSRTLLAFASLVPLVGAEGAKSPQAPVVVVPAAGEPFPVPADAGRGLVRAGASEIRQYSGDKNTPRYIVSRDNGNTWEQKTAGDNYPPNFGGIPKESPDIVLSPQTREYLRVQPINGFVFTTKGGLDGKWLAAAKDGTWEENWKDEQTRKNLVTLGGIMRSPLFLTKRKRVIIPAHSMGAGTWFHISDDGGLTWRKSKDTLSVPKMPVEPPHQGARWYNAGLEASVAELKDGTLWALVRTSHDQHWQSFSKDGGDTWSKAEPSRFFGTLTMPTVGKLKDGRLIALWTNTMALPETKSAGNGTWEDVFTNRDSHHIALSSDNGKSWRGFRELILDEHRNAENYATFQGGEDRGKHQSQFVELPDGNLLISVGQHPAHRRILRVDPQWVYETDRACDFSNGLEDWTIHTYIPKVKGHCSYDRKPGAFLVDNPLTPGRKAMQIKYLDDPSLVDETKGVDYRKGGATWNFPNGEKGRISINLILPENFRHAPSSGIQISLTDRLFNACDETTRQYALYTLPLVITPEAKLILNEKTAIPLPLNRKINLTVTWNGTSKKGRDTATIFLDKKPVGKIPLQNASPNGASYIHFISMAEAPDDGLLIESVKTDIK